MRGVRALVGKELREHRWVFLALWLATVVLAVVTVLWRSVGEVGVGGFVVLRRVLVVGVPLISMALSNRLVVREYRSMTQLFIETLPVSRVTMIAVKYWIGLLFLWVMLGFVGLADLGVVLRSDGLSAMFVAVVASKSLAAATLSWSFFFLLAFMGRYRWLMAAGVILLLGILSITTDLELGRRGLFALLDDRFETDQTTVLWLELGETLALSVVLAALAHAMGLVREGSVAARLATEMSQREKLGLVGLLAVGIFAFSVFDERRRPAPYEEPGAVRVQREGAVVTLLGAAGERGQAEAEHLADELAALNGWLGWPHPFSVHMAHRFSLDPGEYQRGTVENASGVIVRANLTSSEFDRADFVAWVVEALITTPANRRVHTEDRGWVLSGFPEFWVHRQAGSGPLDGHRQHLLGALYGAPTGVQAQDLRDWFSTRRRLGGHVSTSLAWSGLRVIEREWGEAVVRRVVSEMLVAGEASGPALVRDWRRPPARMLEEATGVTLDGLASRWSEALAAADSGLVDEAAGLPRLSATVATMENSSGAARVVFDVHIDPPPAEGTFVTVSSGALVPFAQVLAASSEHRTKVLWTPGATLQSDHGYASGSRVLATVALEVDALGGEVSAPLRTLVVP